MGHDHLFGLPFDPYSLGGQTVLLFLAVLFGGLIGAEREWHGNPAGLRTHVLVCVGSTLITLASVQISLGRPRGVGGDPGHIAAQIVSGIGFLGAGAIMREGATVRGLTTAASVWTVAGLGIAIAAGPRTTELAAIATLFILATLALLSQLEVAFRLKGGTAVLSAEVKISQEGGTHFLDLLNHLGVQVLGMQWDVPTESAHRTDRALVRRVQMRVQLPRGFNRNAFNAALLKEPSLVSFHLE
jgi:putative Mg2+ transporter-C (MgtC) family protein